MKPELQKIFTKLSESKVKQEVEKVELADPDKAINDFKKESKKLVQAENMLRDAQTIAINVRRKLEGILDDLDSSVKGYNSLLRGQNKDFLDPSMIKELERQERDIKTANSQAKGRKSRAVGISEGVKRILSR
jgi:hypothetical protein